MAAQGRVLTGEELLIRDGEHILFSTYNLNAMQYFTENHHLSDCSNAASDSHDVQHYITFT